VRALYGDGNAAALVENCSTRLILRCAGGGGSSTATFASSLIGQQSYMKSSFNEGAGPGGKSSGTLLAAHTEDAVMPSEIERLADLAGYLKVPSRPEWHLVKVPYRDMPQHTASFVS
jgi:type IV secretory pathway TraG/TraD family ATPase VirD4